MDDKVRALVVVSGKVQGVFYRATTRKVATRLGVQGWVRNNRDGTVEALLEGDASAVNRLIQWCEKGPIHSDVQKVTVTWQGHLGEFDGFEVRYR